VLGRAAKNAIEHQTDNAPFATTGGLDEEVNDIEV
jgi:hypothetical protein